MGFCSKCGKELADDAFFCPRCGVRTAAGVTAGATPPVMEEMRDALLRAGKEIEKAVNKAAKEMDDTLTKAKENVHATKAKMNQTCPNCGAANLGNAAYCPKCGTKLS
ncbi:MAG: zinc-ribbon domain-containing protein [Candidatus Methanomethylicus sp.]|nr:zinc-ribbon domain-containing protein [Candidatus Methanomethylicus sp.]